MMEIKSSHNKFYIGENEKQAMAEISWIISGSIIIANHTYVAEELRGQNIAKQLFNKLIELAKQENKKIKPVCSYVVAQFDKNPELEDIKVK